jgi:hypothetical protein
MSAPPQGSATGRSVQIALAPVPGGGAVLQTVAHSVDRLRDRGWKQGYYIHSRTSSTVMIGGSPWS